MKPIAYLGLLAVLATGCVDDDTSIDPADYDRSCSDKTECVIVTVGDLCNDTCEEAAISRTDYARYLADRDAIVCPEEEPNVWLCTGEPTELLCVEGRCVLY